MRTIQSYWRSLADPNAAVVLLSAQISIVATGGVGEILLNTIHCQGIAYPAATLFIQVGAVHHLTDTLNQLTHKHAVIVAGAGE